MKTFYSLLRIVVCLYKTSRDWMTIFEMTMSVDVGTFPSHVVMNMAFRNDTVPDGLSPGLIICNYTRLWSRTHQRIASITIQSCPNQTSHKIIFGTGSSLCSAFVPYLRFIQHLTASSFRCITRTAARLCSDSQWIHQQPTRSFTAHIRQPWPQLRST